MLKRNAKPVILTIALVWALNGLNGTMAAAQDPEDSPWWPHPLWGEGDQAGASNWITPEKVLEVIELVKTGTIYELGHVYERGMPLLGRRSYSSFTALTSGPNGRNQMLANEEYLCAEIGQVGTQFDGLGHIGKRVRMADGNEKDVYYNGFTGEEVYGRYGLNRLGVENVKPFITRGILVDVASYKGVERLEGSYEVTLADVRGALQKQGIPEERITKGDALFFRYGWASLWGNPERFMAPERPGIGMEVARWVVAQNVSLVGSDQTSTEVVPSADPELSIPVHIELLTRNGIFNLEAMALDELAEEAVYEFLFIFTPVRFKGATGSPGRPIAIR